MLPYAILFSVSSVLFLYPSTSFAKEEWEIVQEHLYDWDGDGKKDKFEMLLPKHWNDPAQYRKIKITFSSQLACELNIDGGIGFKGAEVADDGSRFLVFLKDEHSKWPVLMIRNFVGGRSPDEVVLYFLPEGKCPKEFWRRSLFLTSARTNKKNLQIIGAAGAEAINDQTTTYSPTLVYHLSAQAGGKLDMVIDEEASKIYNKKRNYPWVGPTTHPSKVVFAPRPIVIEEKDLAKVTAAYEAFRP